MSPWVRLRENAINDFLPPLSCRPADDTNNTLPASLWRSTAPYGLRRTSVGGGLLPLPSRACRIHGDTGDSNGAGNNGIYWRFHLILLLTGSRRVIGRSTFQIYRFESISSKTEKVYLRCRWNTVVELHRLVPVINGGSTPVYNNPDFCKIKK